MRPQKRTVFVPETNKKPGLSYTASPEGLELPVIDVTHPAFELRPGDEEIADRVTEAIRDLESRERMPVLVRRLLLRFFLRDSILAHGIAASRGTYMDGMGTYLLKLGPDNLGTGYAQEIDKKIAASLPCFSARLRLQAIAEMIAAELIAPLASTPLGELHLVNIAGGPASDSLNALIVLRRRRAELLEGHKIFIDVLDRDDAGPAFGARSLDALRLEGAPLHGVDVEFHRMAFDWSAPTGLGSMLPLTANEKKIVVGSSEGGLFEYGSDKEILEVLRDFREATPLEATFTGSLSRSDGYARHLNQAGGTAVRLWNLEDFVRLVQSAGWAVSQTTECPLSLVVCLKKSG